MSLRPRPWRTARRCHGSWLLSVLSESLGGSLAQSLGTLGDAWDRLWKEEPACLIPPPVRVAAPRGLPLAVGGRSAGTGSEQRGLEGHNVQSGTCGHSQPLAGRDGERSGGEASPVYPAPSAAGAHLLIRALTKRLSREPGVPRLCPMLAEDTWGQRTPSLTSGGSQRGRGEFVRKVTDKYDSVR